MTSKDAVELAYIEFQKYLDEDVNNQWLKNVIEGLKKAEKDLERLEAIDNANPSEAFKGRITYGNNSDLKLYWDKCERYNCNCIVGLKVSNSSYIRNVLKREVVSPVCEDGYYVGGGYALKDLSIIYDRLQQYEDLGDLETIKQALLKAQEQEKVLETMKADLIIELNNKKNAIEMFKQERISREKQDEILNILKDKEVDVNLFITLIPFHNEEDLMRVYNGAHWKGKLTLEETIKVKEWLDNDK